MTYPPGREPATFCRKVYIRYNCNNLLAILWGWTIGLFRKSGEICGASFLRVLTRWAWCDDYVFIVLNESDFVYIVSDVIIFILLWKDLAPRVQCYSRFRSANASVIPTFLFVNGFSTDWGCGINVGKSNATDCEHLRQIYLKTLRSFENIIAGTFYIPCCCGISYSSAITDVVWTMF